MNRRLRKILADYVEEIDAVVDADDGTLVPWPLVEKHQKVKIELDMYDYEVGECEDTSHRY